MASWEGILDNVFDMKFELGEIEVTISGDLADRQVEENLDPQRAVTTARSA